MTLARAAEVLIGAPREAVQGSQTGLGLLVRRLSPSEGWVTHLVLLCSLLVVTWSVNLANWVETPTLIGIMLWSTMTGLVLSKVRLHGALLILLAAVIGGLIVYWQASTLAESESFFGRFQEMNTRLVVWWSAVVSGGISTDLLPFGLMLAAFTWIVGITATWSVFRFHNVWGAILPGSVGLVSNLSYLPDRFAAFLFLYLFFAALLMVRIHSIDRQKRWERQRTGYTSSLGWFTLWDGAVFAILVFIIAVLLPARPAVSEAMRNFWNQSRSPMDSVEGEFNRLFSQIPSRKDNPLAQYGPHLPFQGSLHTTDTPVLYIKSDFPTYWRVRVYGTYTPGGWLGERTERHALPWLPTLAQPVENRARIELEQNVSPVYPMRQLAMGSTPLEAAQPSEIEVLAAPVYTLDARTGGGAAALPPDLLRALGELRALPGGLDRDQLSQRLLQILPESALITRFTAEDAQSNKQERFNVKVDSEDEYAAQLRRVMPRNRQFRLVSLDVRRKQPYPPDVVSVMSKSQIKAGQSYTVTSWISVASPQELNEAASAYPGWVLDRYLQLPAGLPDRVRRLAQQVTRNAITPFEKATALESYLQKNFTYNLEIAAPPPSADGVDHFLFSSKVGYSDYYASAMAVMSRAIGLPARLVVGFAPGRFDSASELFVVRDADSHAWVEVYFPGYGWIEFEPTPGKGEIPRGLPLPAEEDFLSNPADDPFAQGSELPFEVDANQPPEQAAEPPASSDWAPYAWGAGVVATLLVVIALGFWVWYVRTFVRIHSPALAYDRMARLAAFVRVGPQEHQTPQEYARALGSQFPTLRDDIRAVATLYSTDRYSGRASSTEETSRVLTAWRRVRSGLVRRLYRR